MTLPPISLLLLSLLAMQQADVSIVNQVAAATNFVDRIEIHVIGAQQQDLAGASVTIATENGVKLGPQQTDVQGRTVFESQGLNPDDGNIRVEANVPNVGANGAVAKWELKPVTVQVMPPLGEEGPVYSMSPALEMGFDLAYETSTRECGYEYTVCKPIVYQQPMMYQQPQFIQVYYVPVQQPNGWCPLNWF